MASLKKRLMAYLLDIIILVLLLTTISIFIPTSDNAIALTKEINDIQNNYLNNKIVFTDYFKQISNVMKDVDMENLPTGIIEAIMIILYFVIYPFYHKGQTLGKKRFKIRVVSDDDKNASINQLLIRNIIINNLGYLLTQLLIIFILPNQSYYITLCGLSFLQITVIIISVFMIVKKEERKGLHDVIAKTKVIEVKK